MNANYFIQAIIGMFVYLFIITLIYRLFSRFQPIKHIKVFFQDVKAFFKKHKEEKKKE